jgi:hypothetical protein
MTCTLIHSRWAISLLLLKTISLVGLGLATLKGKDQPTKQYILDGRFPCISLYYRDVNAHFLALFKEVVALANGIEISLVVSTDGTLEVVIPVLQRHLLETFKVVAFPAAVTNHKSVIKIKVDNDNDFLRLGRGI